MAKTPFTEEEAKLIQQAAYTVWSEVAYDVIQGIATMKNKRAESITVSRSVAIEVALDADRTEQELRRMRDPLVTPDLLKRVQDADYLQLIRVVKPAFPHARYGL